MSAGGDGGVVIAVGSRADVPARIVAERRDWETVRARDLDAAGVVLSDAESARAAVVVALTQDTRPGGLLHLVDANARAPRPLSLGFVTGREPGELECLAARFPRQPSVGRADSVRIFRAKETSSRSWGAALCEARDLVGSPQEYARLLTEPAEVLILSGHSNGLDMTVGDAVLCRQGTFQAGLDEPRVLPCFHDGVCTRTRGRAVRVNADQLMARRVISITCWGFSPAEHPFVGAATLGDALRLHAEVEALLTTLRAAALAPSELSLIYGALRSGEPFGLIALRVNRFRLWAGQPADLLCLGDPESRLEPAMSEGHLVDFKPGLFGVAVSGQCGGDLTVMLPVAALPADPVVLVEGQGSECLGGALEPGGRLWLSTPAARRDGVVRGAILDMALLREEECSLGRLREDVVFLDDYLPNLPSLDDDEERMRARAFEAALRLRGLVVKWPLSGLGRGSVIARRGFDAVHELLLAREEALANALLDLYAAFCARRGGLHLANWLPLFRRAGVEPGEEPCAYCGHPVGETLYVARAGPQERRVGSCLACGIVYDGRPSVARWLRTGGGLRAGGTSRVTLSVRNGTSLPSFAGLSAVAERFELGESCVARGECTRVEPGGEVVLGVDLTIPETAPVGTWYLSGAAVLGAHVQFLRCPVRVAPSHPRRLEAE